MGIVGAKKTGNRVKRLKRAKKVPRMQTEQSIAMLQGLASAPYLASGCQKSSARLTPSRCDICELIRDLLLFLPPSDMSLAGQAKKNGKKDNSAVSFVAIAGDLVHSDLCVQTMLNCYSCPEDLLNDPQTLAEKLLQRLSKVRCLFVSDVGTGSPCK